MKATLSSASSRTTLYLDTARYGLASRVTRHAMRDFALLSSTEGLSLRFEDFLRHGCDACGATFEERYAGLGTWRGMAGLRRSVRSVTDASSESEVFFASRSAEFMRFAARLLFRRCKNVFTSDLSWPAYEEILQAESVRARGRLTRVGVRDEVLRDRLSVEDVVRRIARAYCCSRCDGLFLPAVSHDGIRVPVEQVYNAVAVLKPPEFVVIDGAQAANHVPVQRDVAVADIFLFGCHKWLAAHHPLGVALAPRRRSRGFVRESLRQMLDFREIADSLLHFTSEVEVGGNSRFSETVDVSPLFSAQSALTDAASESLSRRYQTSAENARALAFVASEAGWQVESPSAELRSGVFLLREGRRVPRVESPDRVRRQFQEAGVSVTTYDGGIVRVSAPQDSLHDEDRARFFHCLQHVSRTPR